MPIFLFSLCNSLLSTFLRFSWGCRLWTSLRFPLGLLVANIHFFSVEASGCQPITFFRWGFWLSTFMCFPLWSLAFKHLMFPVGLCVVWFSDFPSAPLLVNLPPFSVGARHGQRSSSFFPLGLLVVDLPSFHLWLVLVGLPPFPIGALHCRPSCVLSLGASRCQPFCVSTGATRCQHFSLVLWDSSAPTFLILRRRLLVVKLPLFSSWAGGCRPSPD